jgi:hypothetical protein
MQEEACVMSATGHEAALSRTVALEKEISQLELLQCAMGIGA